MLFMPQPTDSARAAGLLQAVPQDVGLWPTCWWVTPQTARLTHPTSKECEFIGAFLFNIQDVSI
jgi:hypothetical protein